MYEWVVILRCVSVSPCGQRSCPLLEHAEGLCLKPLVLYSLSSLICLPPFHGRVVDNDVLVNKLLEVYLAFEALTDHPYEFSSIIDGFFPLLTSCDGCNKLATNNMTLDKFLKQREKQIIDMDLSACWLTLSMLSPLVFSKRLQFVYTTPMTFSRHNRKSNIFVLDARGPVSNQSLDGLNHEVLTDWVNKEGKGVVDALNGANLTTLQKLYKDCLLSRKKTTGQR